MKFAGSDPFTCASDMGLPEAIRSPKQARENLLTNGRYRAPRSIKGQGLSVPKRCGGDDAKRRARILFKHMHQGAHPGLVLGQ